jgi:hypothetical protein
MSSVMSLAIFTTCSKLCSLVPPRSGWKGDLSFIYDLRGTRNCAALLRHEQDSPSGRYLARWNAELPRSPRQYDDPTAHVATFRFERFHRTSLVCRYAIIDSPLIGDKSRL